MTASSTPAQPRPSFLDGVRALGRGVRFVVGKPAHWPLALVPVAMAAILTTVASALGLWGTVHAAHAFAAAHPGAAGAAVAVLLGIVLGAGAIVVALLLALSLAQPLSGSALDALSRKQMVALGRAIPPEVPWHENALRSVGVTLTALAVGLPILALLSLLDFLVPLAIVVTTPLKLVLSALLIAWDLLDYPLGLHGVAVRDRLRWIGKNFRSVLGFGLASSLSLFVPGLGLLLLPVGVTGATRLVLDADKNEPPHARVSREPGTRVDLANPPAQQAPGETLEASAPGAAPTRDHRAS